MPLFRHREERIGRLDVPAGDYMSPEQADADDTIDNHERLEPTLEQRYYDAGERKDT